MDDKTVSIQITLDRNDGVIRAQSWLKGKVHIVVQGEPVEVTELAVHLQGKEVTFLPGSPTSFSKSFSYQENVILQETQVLNTFDVNTPLKPGEYSFPYSIYLPGSLPPTMKHEDEEGSCRVEYTLTATFLPDRPYQRSLDVVGAPLTQKHYPFTILPTSFRVKSLAGLLDQGYVGIAVKADNTHVGKGRYFEISFSARNRSKVDLTGAVFNLIEHVEWEADGRHGTKDTEQTILALDSKDSPCISRTPKESHSWLDLLDHSKMDADTETKLMKDLSLPQHRLQLLVPSVIKDSYDGSLLKVSHLLKLSLVIDGKVQQADVSIPIKVFDPPIENGHHRVPSKESIDQVNAMWPDDSKVLHHLHCNMRGAKHSPSNSCGSINELAEESH